MGWVGLEGGKCIGRGGEKGARLNLYQPVLSVWMCNLATIVSTCMVRRLQGTIALFILRFSVSVWRFDTAEGRLHTGRSFLSGVISPGVRCASQQRQLQQQLTVHFSFSLLAN